MFTGNMMANSTCACTVSYDEGSNPQAKEELILVMLFFFNQGVCRKLKRQQIVWTQKITLSSE